MTTVKEVCLNQINEEEEEAHILQKKYEAMSFEEMSQRMAESNRQISQMLSSSTSTTTTISAVEEDENNNDPYKKYTRLFTRTASNGDLIKIKEMLADNDIRHYIDVNAIDSDGTPPLIYAACFGKTEIAKVLLEAGAQIDAQDSFGWSALMWATNNSHELLVKILLDYGASSQTKSAKGRTVFDLITNTENQKIIDILATNPRDSVSSTSSLFYRTTSSVSSNTTTLSENDFYFQPSAITTNEDILLEEANRLFEYTTMKEDEEAEEEDGEEDYCNNKDNTEEEQQSIFNWDKCSPDQMFVFNSNDLNYILDTVITNIELPLSNQQDICISSNIIFLSARFAHYFSSQELLNQVLEGALNRISKTIKINHSNIHILSFWITNLSKLLFYLKKDIGLVVVTAEQQLELSELISETYNLIIIDTEKRLEKLLDPAMLNHEEITGMDNVDFTDDWQRFFRASSSNNSRQSTDITAAIISPQSITSLLSSILFVLQSYDVHPIITIQALAQFFHFISCELFNRILTNKKLLCRSKAIQIRMNFSHLQDWISVNKLPNHLLSYLNPSIQLLQLLQCLTHLQDLVDFINTSKKFDALNAPQIKRCVISYRYEVNESRIPEEIEKYAMQCAEDTVRHKQQRRKTAALSRSESSRRRASAIISVRNNIISADTTTLYDEPIEQNDIAEEDNDDDIKEQKDAKFMLPFSIPTTTHMVSFNHWDNHKSEERRIIPVIPEEWMDKLDKPCAAE